MNFIASVCLVSICLLLPQLGRAQAIHDDNSCEHHVAQWLDPESGETLTPEQFFESLAGARIVLLGEAHTSAAHHRWQHYMLAALHSQNPNMMIGFEMLPRRAQPVLDAWSAGRLTEKEFLEQSRWQDVWGFDPEFYLPLLHFARLNRLPTIALNVDRELVSKVGKQGWQALSEEQRMGLGDPAPASDDYRASLARVFAFKQSFNREDESEAVAPDLDELIGSDELANFVDAQLTWDRAMAEALAGAHRRDPSALVVGIVGRGHLEYGFGIPHQLLDLGIEDVDVLLPFDASESCDPLPADLATAVFVVDSEAGQPLPSRPRLGIIIEASDDGVRVMQVVADSVADRSGIVKGDLIRSAAGFETTTNAALIEVIQRQAPGTWLPLKITRGQKTLELVARFPKSFE